MKKTYHITFVKNGLEQTFVREMQGYQADEIRVVSSDVARAELEREVAEIHRQNSFKEKTVPALVFFGSLFLMSLAVMQSWGLI